MTDAFEANYQGRAKSLTAWAKGKSIASGPASALVSASTSATWSTLLPASVWRLIFRPGSEYPSFSVLITSAYRDEAARDALRPSPANTEPGKRLPCSMHWNYSTAPPRPGPIKVCPAKSSVCSNSRALAKWSIAPN